MGYCWYCGKWLPMLYLGSTCNECLSKKARNTVTEPADDQVPLQPEGPK